MLNFHEFLHTVHRYVLNSVVKISLMFAQYFEYYANALVAVGRGMVAVKRYYDKIFQFVDGVLADTGGPV